MSCLGTSSVRLSSSCRCLRALKKQIQKEVSNYCILSRKVSIFFKENYDEILSAHHTLKVPKKGFKID